MKTIGNNTSDKPKKTWMTPRIEIISTTYIEGGTHIGDTENHVVVPKAGFPSSSTAGTIS